MPTTDRLRTALADRYAIDRQIGAGGMATVFLARDVKHDRDVALKVLRPDLSAVIGVDRFLAEVKITARLDHPHILTLIDSGEADGILFYVMPFVRGESLRAKLEREKQLGLDEALSITRQVASALDYAHKQGVVHRDIKPENILLHEGEAVLADFGIALAVKEAGGNRLTETGLSLGTPQYMSPEQATGDRTLDARSDIYSLGAVLYEMIAGEPPVTGATAQAMIAKLLTERPTRLRVVRDTVPEAMERAVEKALAKTPADRFTTAGDFMRALESAAISRRSTSVRMQPRTAFIAAAAVVAIVAAAALIFWRIGGRATAGASASLGDRVQVTNSGNVRTPSISGDGKTLAYVVTTCGATGCLYGVELRDVDGAVTRRIFDGATAIYSIEWSPDRRNLLLAASVAGQYGTFLLSILGGVPHRVSMYRATFWAGGDSLLTIGPVVFKASYWVLVAGLDGISRDSIQVAGPADGLMSVSVVPNSRWIVVGSHRKLEYIWRVIDRGGHEASRFVFSNREGIGGSQAAGDAFWIATFEGGGTRSALVRISLDAATGRFSSHADTIGTSAFTAFGVTADGSSLVLDDGTAMYDSWLLDLPDALHGNFAPRARIDHSTSSLAADPSPDGSRLFIRRTVGAGEQGIRRLVRNTATGAEVTLNLAGNQSSALDWVDTITLAVETRSPRGVHLGLMNALTGSPRDGFDVPDSSIRSAAYIKGGGWAWIPRGSRTIAVQRRGDPTPKRYPIPAWFDQALRVATSADGRYVAFTGWRSPDEDSLGIGVLTIADGTISRWHAMIAESLDVVTLGDGGFAILVTESQDTQALYKLRGPGQVERLGTIPRPVAGISLSRDARKVGVVTRDYQGDVWMSKVIRH